MTFYVGQKVVRFSGTCQFRQIVAPPIKEIITVSWVGLCCGEETIDILEYPSPASGTWRRGYYAKYFRPVTERKTDISIFTAMLTPNRQSVDA